MPGSKTGLSAKAQRKEHALKRARRQKLILIGVCVLAAAAVLVFVIQSGVQESGTETFSGGGLIVQLLDDGKFSASLAHNVRKSGTYTKTDEGSGTRISFNVNGVIEVGWIENNALRVPVEWEDACGHTNILPKR